MDTQWTHWVRLIESVYDVERILGKDGVDYKIWTMHGMVVQELHTTESILQKLREAGINFTSGRL